MATDPRLHSQMGPGPALPRKGGPRFWLAAAVLGLLFLLGMAGLALRLREGLGDRAAWGYYAATFSYLLSTAQMAPLVSIGLRLTQAHWRRPLARASELFAVVGVLSLFWFLPLLWLVPSAEGRRSIWFQWPLAPHLWDTLGLAFLVLCGLALLYMAALPDLAAARDRAPEGRWWHRLLPSWRGASGQWRVLRSGLIFLGAFYFLAAIFVHTVFSADFALSLVPGWKDPLFPTYHAVSGLQAGVATVIVTLFLLRRWGGLGEYIGLGQFWGLGKVLLALTLIWFYFWWSGFIVFWYGRRPEEELLLQLFMTGPYRVAFYAAFGLNFVAPFLLLLWNPVRRSIWGPTLAAALILIGTLLDRIRLFVASYSVGDEGRVLEALPAARLPQAADILIILGGLAGAALFYLLAARALFPLSRWEVREGELLEEERTFLRRKVKVIAKVD